MIGNGQKPQAKLKTMPAGAVLSSAEPAPRSSAKPPIRGKRPLPNQGKENHLKQNSTSVPASVKAKSIEENLN